MIASVIAGLIAGSRNTSWHFIWLLLWYTAATATPNIDSCRLVLQMPEDSMCPLWKLQEQLQQYKMEKSMALLEDLQQSARPQNVYDLKLEWLRARCLSFYNRPLYDDSIMTLTKRALPLAKSLKAWHLVVEWCALQGGMLNVAGKREEALVYLVEAIRVSERIGHGNFPYPYHWYGDIALVLFELGDYKNCAQYYRYALNLGKDDLDQNLWMNAQNTIGVCYLRLGMFDSARANFDRSYRIAQKLNNKLWQGIISGNYGQLCFEAGRYDSARMLMEKDYEANKAWNEWRNVANALQWLARIDLAQGKVANALPKVRKALQILQTYPRNDYLEYSLHTTAQTHMALGQTDSAGFYFKKYFHLHDSLSLAGRPDLVELASLQLDHANAAMDIQALQQKQQAEKLWRNGLMALVVVLSAAAIWIQIANRRRLAAEKKLAESEQAIAAAALQAAHEKLRFFTQSLLEKNEALIGMEKRLEKFQSQPDGDAIRQLTETTILTDADWEKFKILFEVPYPGFFSRVKSSYHDITPGEIRMAALIKLQLSAREMASILGISTISVYKSRQRLRQRVGVESDEQLEALLKAV